jgi:hypothetical protein
MVQFMKQQNKKQPIKTFYFPSKQADYILSIFYQADSIYNKIDYIL